MIRLLCLSLFSASCCVAAVIPINDTIAESVSLLGRHSSTVTTVFDRSEKKDGVVFMEKRFAVGDESIFLTVTVEMDQVVQISWFAKPGAKSDSFSGIFNDVVVTLGKQGFKIISHSVAINGKVVLGDRVTHSDSGTSFWIRLNKANPLTRVDMTYSIAGGEDGRFNITVGPEIRAERSEGSTP